MGALHKGTSLVESYDVKILFLIICSAVSIKGASSSKLKVTLRLWVKSSQSVVSLRTSSSIYQFFGITSRVCTNKCVYSCLGTEFHVAVHCVRWSIWQVNPVYLCAIYSVYVSNLTCNTLLHCCQLSILSLCTTHHLVGVTFSVTSKAKNLCWFGICNSNSLTKESICFIPSYFDGSHTLAPIQRNVQVIWTHLLVDTSCSLYFQCSISSS